MKLTAIILLSACMVASATGNTQSITISVKNAPLEKVFEQIKKQTGYTFLYKDEVIKKAGKINLNVSNVSVETALQICFKDLPLTFKVFENKTIVVAVKETISPNGEGIGDDVSLSLTKTIPPIDITGKVTDADGNPLSGATVKVKGSSKGTTTNNDGVFVLKGVDDNAVLEISFVGFETYTIAVNNKTTIAASLKVKPESLNEVVINKGYYTEKQKISVGNVSKITSNDIEKQPVTNPLLTIQGRAAGVEVTQATGVVGGGVTIRIRGLNSFLNGRDPFYVIDGVPYQSQNLPGIGGILQPSGIGGGVFGNPLNNINVSDIESIEILKDADATAIYGSRAANGAILITTKKGKSGAAKVDINLSTGWGRVTRFLDLMDRREYLDMRYEALKNDNIPIGSVSVTTFDMNGRWDTTRTTDWQKELIGNTSRYSNVQASVSGGSSNVQYLISGTYNKQTSVFPDDFSDRKGAMHFNISGGAVRDKLKFLLSGNYISDDNQLPSNDLSTMAVQLAPVAPKVYNEDGSINWAPTIVQTVNGPVTIYTWQNPMAYQLNTFRNRTNNLITNSVISYKLFNGLDFKSSFGYTNTQTNEFIANPWMAISPSARASTPRSARYSNNSINSWIIEPQLNYGKKIGKGKIELLLGTTFQKNKTNGEVRSASGFNSDLVLEDVKSAPSITINSTVASEYKYNALFARGNFNYDDRYILNLTARRDGSSRFGPDNQFHNFGAFGVGWIFSNERFIEKQIKCISFGKIRFSYGTTGSDQIGDYRYLNLYNAYSVGLPYQSVTGLVINNLYNPALAWEETKKGEGGIELGFFDRVFVNTSFYFNQSSNQLATYQLPSNTGFTSIVTNVDALIKNEGWEFVLSGIPVQTKNFRWNSSVNFTVQRNKLVSLGPNFIGDDLRKVGHSLNTVFLYKFAGTDPATGIHRFFDSKGNLINNPQTVDQTVVLDLTPEYFGGLQNVFSYKGFQFDFLFQFIKQIGRNNIFGGGNEPGTFAGGLGNQPTSFLEHRWTQVGDNALNQRFNHNFNNDLFIGRSSARSSDAAYSDASFVRLKNLAFSYHFSDRLNNKLHLHNLKAYLSCQNLLTITKYEGSDPETQSTTSLPPLRMITTGIQIGL